jgi:vacuolar-type H+-ATPase subunit H
MTEEILRSVRAAEETAARTKATATEQATNTVREAEQTAEQKERTSQEVCKAYRATQAKLAEEEATNAYNETLKKARKEAKAYAEELLKESEKYVVEIVGRITSGDC